MLIPHEMLCTLRGYKTTMIKWTDRAMAIPIGEQPGHRAYAFKQAALWGQFESQAKTMFAKALKELPSVA